MATDFQRVERAYQNGKWKEIDFPKVGGFSNDVPNVHGVYIIKKGKSILYVGKTNRAQDGLRQRLTDHLYGRSSFRINYKGPKGKLDIRQCKIEYIKKRDHRIRALLEAYATGMLCPKYIGTGERGEGDI